MAEEFGAVINNLWNSKYSWTYANVLRVRTNESLLFLIRSFLLQSFVAKRHQEFVGNGQHDAQELLTILLDAVHEVRYIHSPDILITFDCIRISIEWSLNLKFHPWKTRIDQIM